MNPIPGLTPTFNPPIPGPKLDTFVFYLKTHKTGSTTLQNILFRFAERHDLKVALPGGSESSNEKYRFRYGTRFKKENINLDNGHNIIAHHMRLDNPELEKSVIDEIYSTAKDSREIPFKITIMREPVSLFKSSFDYFKQSYKPFTSAGNLTNFLKSPEKFYKKSKKDCESCTKFGRNCVSFDLGFSADEEDPDEISKMVKTVDDSFDFVLILEYFEESLILLKHKMSEKYEIQWTYEDILFAKLNVGKERGESNFQENEAIINWLSSDSVLYDHFNNSLWNEIEQYGVKNMDREKRILAGKQATIQNTGLPRGRS